MQTWGAVSMKTEWLLIKPSSLLFWNHKKQRDNFENHTQIKHNELWAETQAPDWKQWTVQKYAHCVDGLA